jgi:hypothetical protein
MRAAWPPAIRNSSSKQPVGCDWLPEPSSLFSYPGRLQRPVVQNQRQKMMQL